MSTLERIDSIFRLVNREIWIVTAAAGSRRGGLVATWVSQASIDSEHPVVVVGIAPNHFTAELIDGSGAFTLHLITADQIDLAWNFAIGSGRDRDKLARVPHSTTALGPPRLDDCLAWLDCRVYARLATGDRNYYWADILDGARKGDEPPLREQTLFATATDEQRRQLIANRDFDIGIQRPQQQNWRENVPDLLRLD